MQLHSQGFTQLHNACRHTPTPPTRNPPQAFIYPPKPRRLTCHCQAGPSTAPSGGSGSNLTGSDTSDGSDEDDNFQNSFDGWNSNAKTSNIVDQTLKVLNWGEILSAVSQFAQTQVGRQRILTMKIPKALGQILKLYRSGVSVEYVFHDMDVPLRFDGIDTQTAQQAIQLIQNGTLCNGKQLLSLVTVLNGVLRIQRDILASKATKGPQKGKGSAYQALSQKFANVPMCPAYVQHILNTVDKDGSVLSSQDPELSKLRGQERSIMNDIRDQYRSQNGVLTLFKDRVVLLTQPVESLPAGIVLGRTPEGKVYYELRSVVQMNNRQVDVKRQIKAIERQCYLQLSREGKQYIDIVQDALELILWLDTTNARVCYGLWTDGYFAHLSNIKYQQQSLSNTHGSVSRSAFDEYHMLVKGLRQPLMWQRYLALEQRFAAQKKSKGKQGRVEQLTREMVNAARPEPIDLTVDKKVKTVVITGPNTGGKTSVLFSVGQCCLMALCGIPIPAQPPILLPKFTEILADIGDDQSVSTSLSTFSSHISSICDILQHCYSNSSLVLLDELGTGTDPTEGGALAAAILECLQGEGEGSSLLTLATTHQAALAQLKYNTNSTPTSDPSDPNDISTPTSTYENASIEFDNVAMKPTYKLSWGVPGSSHAITVAKNYGLPEEIINQAEEDLGSTSIAVGKQSQQVQQQETLLKASQENLTKIINQTQLAQKQADKLREQRQLQAAQQAVSYAAALSKLSKAAQVQYDNITQAWEQAEVEERRRAALSDNVAKYEAQTEELVKQGVLKEKNLKGLLDKYGADKGVTQGQQGGQRDWVSGGAGGGGGGSVEGRVSGSREARGAESGIVGDVGSGVAGGGRLEASAGVGQAKGPIKQGGLQKSGASQGGSAGSGGRRVNNQGGGKRQRAEQGAVGGGGWRPKVGESVVVIKMNKIGKVVSVKGGGMYSVMLGRIPFNVKLNQIQKVEQ